MRKIPPLLKPVLAILCCGAAITGWCRASPLWGIPGPVLVYQRPIDAMVDVTNDLGVAVLQDYAYTRSNFAFSPYGVVSVLVVLYEGARGESARQIHNVLRLPWNRDVTRIGFRDIHRHLRGYFSHEGYLSGLTLNKLNTSLLPEYRRVLRFYGYDVGLADEYGPFPPRRPTTTTTTTSSPEAPTVTQGTTKSVECNTETEPATKETTLTTLVSEEDTTLKSTTSEPSFSTVAPGETSPTIPITVKERSTTPTTMDTSTITVTETSPNDDTATSFTVPVTTQDASNPFTPTSDITTTIETSSPATITESTFTDATKAEETPTIQGSSIAPYTSTENTDPAFTTVEEALSTTKAAETTLPEQSISSTLPTSSEETTAVKEDSATTASSPAITEETTTIEAATTKAATFPIQPITSTVPTSLEEITTITQSTESVFSGTENTSPVTVSSTDDATTKVELLPAQPDTTKVPTGLPEVPTTVQETEAVFTDAVKDSIPTTVANTSPPDDTKTTVAFLPEQSSTSTVPTTLEDRTIIQTTISVLTNTVDEYTSPTTSLDTTYVDVERTTAVFSEQPATSTVPNNLKEITNIVDNTVPVFTDAEENTSSLIMGLETSTAVTEIVPELSTASRISVISDQMETTTGSTVLTAAKLKASSARTSSLLQRETANIPEETSLTTTPFGLLNYSADISSVNYTEAVTSTDISRKITDIISELPSRTARLVSSTNSSTFVEGTSEIPQLFAATTEDIATNMTVTGSLYKYKPEQKNKAITKSDEPKIPPSGGRKISLKSKHEDNFTLEPDNVFTKALGALKNESTLERVNSTKQEAKVENADMLTKEEVKPNGTSTPWDYTMPNKAVPLLFTDKTREFGEMPSVNRSRNRRAVAADEPAVFFPDISLQLQNGMFDSQVSRGYDLFGRLHRRPFLIDGATEELVPMMSYTSVFPYAYINSLHAQALEFPLDDERYRLLILLPVERRGLRQLIYDLNSCPLRNVFEALKPTRVQAIIPSFMVEGFVILTPTLQQLGVWDVFDPRRADLSGMSSDPELYVRNIEQAVTVVIRNYVKILDIQTRTLTARTMLQLFAATHPFLYFVVDSDTHVSLIAGKMVDPLNSRIY